MMSELITDISSEKQRPQYLIPESVYEHDHPDVLYYTQYFIERTKKNGNVFANIDKALKANQDMIVAEKIAGVWSEFSKFVPSFIAKAVSLTADPEHQHHLIQIAYDELGAQNKNHIHSKLFLEALANANIKVQQTSALPSIKKILASLNEALEKIQSLAGIIGLLLSFEIIAETNIETVFKGLSVDSQRQDILTESLFFKIHRMNEIEHIRHSVANFLRFSTSEQDIEEAKQCFDIGITFWQHFWDRIAVLIATE